MTEPKPRNTIQLSFALYFCIIAIFILVGSCNNGVKNGELIFTEARTENGFNFPYFLFIPDKMSVQNEQVLIVEPNNSGFVSDDLKKHIEKAKRTASLEFYTGNYVARKLKYPLLVPVFPRSKTDWKIYTRFRPRCGTPKRQ
ncbi:MAG: hypothetical protein K0B11_21225 [Mariniphaga sp.]|nr:hypothetical protein [Mariniphaga sp.]